MSTFKMTFSLASLIFLIALGLVFVATPAMAHLDNGAYADANHDGLAADGTTPLTGADLTAETNHTHRTGPTVTSIELVDVKIGADAATRGMADAESTVMGTSVILVDNAAPGDTDAVAKTDLTQTTDGQFRIKITFSEAVYVVGEATNVGAVTSAFADTDLTAANILDVASSQAAPTVRIDTLTAGTIARDGTDGTTFLATITVPGGNLSGVPMDVWISVAQNAVFSKAQFVAPNDIHGRGNDASAQQKFTIVSAFETPIPTVMIETEAGATVDAPFDVTFTFGDPAPSTFTANDIMVTGGAVTDGPTQDMTNTAMWTATITPVLNATEVMVSVSTDVAVDSTGAQVSETVTATTDSTPPTVMIAMGTQSGRSLPITITVADDVELFEFNEALGPNTVTVTGGELGSFSVNNYVHTSTITIDYDTTSVTVTVAAGAVMDTSNNGNVATTMTFMVTATPTPTAAMLKAGDYLVVVRDKANPPPFGNLSPTLASWSEVSDEAEMPDLERLFDIGGSINVKVEGATRLQVVFSEVMWAVDQGQVDDRAAYLGEQWIELHNRTSGANAKDFALSGIKINTKERRPALAEETDRISTVVGGGEDWVLGKGQNGNSGAADGSGKVEFISMYRNNEGEPGHQSSRWTKSSELYATNHRGTPGQKERAGVQVIGPTNANRSPIIFNEIGNHSNPMYEWIELKNVSGGNVNLKNYEVTMATTKGANQSGHNDVDLIDFTGADRNVPAGGILLVVKSDPTGDPNHPLAAGWNFGARNTWTPAKPGEANWVRGVNENSARYMVASTFNEMPDGDFVLILRNRQDRNGKTDNDNIRDVAGYVPDNGLKVDDGSLFTNLWPLKNFGAPWYRNEFNNGTVHRRQHAGTDGTKRSRTDRDHVDDAAFRDIGWTGVGYKRNAAPVAANGGTPGYPDSADPRHNRFDTTTRSSVIVSEVMPSAGPRNLPEWIELFNTSKTEGVSVNKWRITITNHDQDSADGLAGSFAGDLSISFTLGADVIPPNQPYLIVARHGRDDTNLPDERIHSVGRRAGQLLLNPYGFQIKVEAWEKDNVYHAVETVGNLGAAPTNNRRPDAQSFQAVAWDLPATVNADNVRVSLVRVPDTGAAKGVVDGMKQGAWKLFDMSNQIGKTLDDTYYGHSSDLGSPGHSVGGVLPVSLSKFRPERLKDTGEIVVRWITESELNNAGFNILRSENRDGEFTKVHFVAGQGTTSERTLYEWKDKSAKPNVVYYYQIQDVSLDGEVSVLATTHLRGNVSAAGKLTTTWGELKALQ